MSREIWKQIINEARCFDTMSTEDLAGEFDSLYTVSKKGESIEVRRSRFAERIASCKENYSREMLVDFYNYWVEKSVNGKKMRYELQKVFDVKLRLARWHKNSKANEKSSSKIGRTTEDSIKLFITQNTK